MTSSYLEESAIGSRDMVPARLVVAIGGNATHPEGIRGSPSEQARVAAELGQALRH